MISINKILNSKLGVYWLIASVCWAFYVLLVVDVPTPVSGVDIIFLLGPPIAVFIVGYIIAWALQGFKK